MTSLDIVNRQIHLLEAELKSGVGCIECLKSNLDDWYEIKQDLEILVIIIFLSKNGFDINCLDDNQCKKLNDFIIKVGDSHD